MEIMNIGRFQHLNNTKSSKCGTLEQLHLFTVPVNNHVLLHENHTLLPHTAPHPPPKKIGVRSPDGMNIVVEGERGGGLVREF